MLPASPFVKKAPFVLSTVYVFIGENTALLDFMFAMNETGLLNDGEYVVVAVDNSNDDPISNNTCERFIIPHIFYRDLNLRYARVGSWHTVNLR